MNSPTPVSSPSALAALSVKPQAASSPDNGPGFAEVLSRRQSALSKAVGAQADNSRQPAQADSATDKAQANTQPDTQANTAQDRGNAASDDRSQQASAADQSAKHAEDAQHVAKKDGAKDKEQTAQHSDAAELAAAAMASLTPQATDPAHQARQADAATPLQAGAGADTHKSARASDHIAQERSAVLAQSRIAAQVQSDKDTATRQAADPTSADMAATLRTTLDAALGKTTKPAGAALARPEPSGSATRETRATLAADRISNDAAADGSTLKNGVSAVQTALNTANDTHETEAIRQFIQRTSDARRLSQQADTVKDLNSNDNGNATPISFALHNATASPTAVPVPLAVNTPLQAANWGNDFSQKVGQLGSKLQNGAHTIELRLDPPDLGPIRITIQMNDQVAQASFVSPHAAVRQAVENALPQLQSQFAQAGISLGQTSVSDHGAQGQSQNGNGNGSAAGGGTVLSSALDATQESVLVNATQSSHNGQVDTFA